MADDLEPDGCVWGPLIPREEVAPLLEPLLHALQEAGRAADGDGWTVDLPSGLGRHRLRLRLPNGDGAVFFSVLPDGHDGRRNP